MGQNFKLMLITVIYYLIIQCTYDSKCYLKDQDTGLFKMVIVLQAQRLSHFSLQEGTKFNAMLYSREKLFHVYLYGIACLK